MPRFQKDPGLYLPHRRPMLLLDEVTAADEKSARCRVTIGEQCSLLRQADGSYPNSLFIEFMAQTVGVYAGICDSEKGIDARVGFLLGSRLVKFAKPHILEGEVYDIEACCSFFGEESLPSQFDCRVLHNGEFAAGAVLTVYRPSSLSDFVKENFSS